MEQVDVAIVGGGIGGVGLGARLRERGIESFAILERDRGAGGTWRANTYPGAACDIPSHLYSFSFAPNPDWTSRFPEQREILDYIERVVDETGVRPNLRPGADVTNARFDAAARRWQLSTANGEDVEATHLVAACGQLSNPQIPSFEGLEEFRGASWHSAEWNHDVDLAGKRVAVIGTGASSIQIVPELAKVTEQLHVFQRSAPYVIPRKDRPFTRAERLLFSRVGAARRAYRGYIYWRLESYLLGFRPGTIAASMLTKLALGHLENQVTDPDLRATLTPDYPLGCKRILISDDYYPALQLPRVELVIDDIDRFVPDGIVTRDGHVRELDAVVFATGFDSQALVAPMRVEGPDGSTLDDLWADGPQAHLGVAVAGMPNFFLIYGPNTNLGHNSIVFMLECQYSYIVSCIEEMRRRGVSTIDVRGDVMRRYNDELQERLRHSVWSAGCNNWYKTRSGRITNNWAGPASRYWLATRRPDLNEFALT